MSDAAPALVKVLVASRNAKKLRELQRVLDAAGVSGIEPVGLDAVPEYPEEPETGVYRFSGFTADKTARRVTDEAGQDLDLTGAEFDLLVIFLDRPGRVLSRDTLLDLLHGRSFTDPFDRTIDVTMSRLRRKFGDGGVFRLFKTVRNGGYQFSTQVERVS